MPIWLDLFLVFASLSLVAVGGANVLVPEMHRVLVEQRHWLDGATFSQLIALAQAAPGPNILAGSVMGYWIAGFPGLAGATLGLLLPAALLAWCTAGAVRRLAGARWLKPAQAGLIPIALGLVLASGALLAQSANNFAVAPAIVAAAAGFVWWGRYSPLWVLAAGGATGVAVL